jgi:hypothetical protein
MPNHITNRLTIEGDPRLVKFIYGCIKGHGEDHIDFNQIIPAPAFSFQMPVGDEEERLCEQFGVESWSSFNRPNWGTKWNAYSQKRINENTIEFQTAWNAPVIVIDALAAKFPQFKFELRYADEYAGYNTGIIKWEGSERSEVNRPDGGSNEGFEIYLDLNPDCTYYQKIDGKYEYVETEDVQSTEQD